MTVTGFAASRSVHNDMVRKALDGALFIAPFSTTDLTQSDVFDSTTGVMSALPEGFVDLGWTDPGGFKVSRSIKQSELTPFGATQAIRTDTTEDTETIAVTCWETRLVTLALTLGLDISDDATTNDAGGSVWHEREKLPSTKYWRGIWIAMDKTDDGEFDQGTYYPRLAVTDHDDTTVANGDDPLTRGVTLTSYWDSAAAHGPIDFIGGDGWLAKIADSGFTAGSST